MDLAHARFGPMLKRFRGSRGLSQERLAEHAEVSPRHVSFLENGRAAPSREMVLVLASALDLPLRERNTLLVAAGFAPVYASSPIESATLEPVRRALDHLLRAHEPFGALVVDRDWNVVRMNAGATRLLGWALEGLTPPPEALANLLVAIFHPEALRPRIANFEEIASAMIERVEHELQLETDDARRARMTSLLGSLHDAPRGSAPSAGPALPFLPVRLRRGDRELRLFTTLTTLGTPLDVTAQELRIESYFPADADTERALRDLAGETFSA
ncbi:helix-turn-helix domain-containing protein [Sandaracinus amylolyticus]|uniref:Helix-turn-helix domain protein n=1 Tax=Sandaracinus amylolyticus TaxID=927083 RepID=A0A0F6YJ56_9BACT|nr:helix-turn-helix transcriptional regulator [Sandaracinus amylolyticus]AKF05816.1 helix-turn-helix domain protein [Sandaracinus amylolyticus]